MIIPHNIEGCPRNHRILRYIKNGTLYENPKSSDIFFIIALVRMNSKTIHIHVPIFSLIKE